MFILCPSPISMPSLIDRRKRRRAGIRLPVSLLALTIFTDQLTKVAAERLLAHSGEIPVLGGLATFILVKNFEGFLGIVRGLPHGLQFFFLYVCVTVLLVACLSYLFFLRRPNPRYDLPLSLVTGGGLSNLLDRLLHDGGVTDFVMLSAGKFHTGIFNLADVYILAGSFIFGFQLFSGQASKSDD